MVNVMSARWVISHLVIVLIATTLPKSLVQVNVLHVSPQNLFTCESSCEGYSISNLPKRFSNHKSHIKRNVKSCRLANNFLEKDHDMVRDKNKKEFYLSLVKHVTIKVIDIIDFDQNLSIKEK